MLIKLLIKKILTKVINDAYLISGNYQTVLFLDRLKRPRIWNGDQKVVPLLQLAMCLFLMKSRDILKKAQSEVDDIQKKFDNHILTDGERYNKVIDVWTHATTVMAMTMMGTLKKDREGLIQFT